MKNKNLIIYRNADGKHVIQLDELIHVQVDSYKIEGIVITGYVNDDETFMYYLKEKDTITFSSIYNWRK